MAMGDTGDGSAVIAAIEAAFDKAAAKLQSACAQSGGLSADVCDSLLGTIRANADLATELDRQLGELRALLAALQSPIDELNRRDDEADWWKRGGDTGGD